MEKPNDSSNSSKGKAESSLHPSSSASFAFPFPEPIRTSHDANDATHQEIRAAAAEDTNSISTRSPHSLTILEAFYQQRETLPLFLPQEVASVAPAPKGYSMRESGLTLLSIFVVSAGIYGVKSFFSVLSIPRAKAAKVKVLTFFNEKISKLQKNIQSELEKNSRQMK